MTTITFHFSFPPHLPLCQVAFFLIRARNWVGKTGLAWVERDLVICFTVNLSQGWPTYPVKGFWGYCWHPLCRLLGGE